MGRLQAAKTVADKRLPRVVEAERLKRIEPKDALLGRRVQRGITMRLVKRVRDLEGAECLDLILRRPPPDRIGAPKDPFGADRHEQLSEHTQ